MPRLDRPGCQEGLPGGPKRPGLQVPSCLDEELAQGYLLEVHVEESCECFEARPAAGGGPGRLRSAPTALRSATPSTDRHRRPCSCDRRRGDWSGPVRIRPPGDICGPGHLPRHRFTFCLRPAVAHGVNGITGLTVPLLEHWDARLGRGYGGRGR